MPVSMVLYQQQHSRCSTRMRTSNELAGASIGLKLALLTLPLLLFCFSLPAPFSLYSHTAVSSEERSTPSPSDALSFLRVVGKLKGLKRTGWVHCGVSQPE